MGYAIPSNTALRIVDDIVTNGYVSDRAALGVRVYRSSSYYSTNGVIVSEVIEGGAAQLAGIRTKNQFFCSTRICISGAIKIYIMAACIIPYGNICCCIKII